MKFAIHVGFSKTGTTTLQRHLFAGHSQIEYVGKPYAEEPFKQALHHFMMADSTLYQPKKLDLFQRIQKRMKNADSSKKVFLLSEEMMVSYTKVRDKGVVAQRIKEYLQPQKIIITIRNQEDLLKSAYLSRGRLLLNVPQKYTQLAVSFSEWLELSYTNFQRSYLEHANFVSTIDFYSRLFGKENVCVVVLEELINDTETHINKLSQFLGIDAKEALACVGTAHEHKEITQTILDLERLKTKFFPFHRSGLAGGILKIAGFFKKRKYKDAAAEIHLPEGWEQRLNELYAAGNQRLVDEYHLPLQKYGYPL